LGLDSREKYNLKSFKKKYVKCGEGYIEDYDYVLENNLKVDKLWYLENQCTKNICKLFEPLMNDPKQLLKHSISTQTREQFGMEKGSDISQQLSKFGLVKKQKVNHCTIQDMELL